MNQSHMKHVIRSLLLLIPMAATAQNLDGLSELEGTSTKTYFSAGSHAQALDMAERCDSVTAFYSRIIGFEPTVTLLVLSQADWSSHTNFPVYGMPHYVNDKLIVASEDNPFWKSFIPPLDSLSADLAQDIRDAYTDSTGTLTMRGFFDLLAIHELGHAFHSQGGLTMQRRWMDELFANILLHTYIAEREPDLLPALTVFPRMVVASTDTSTLKFTTLNELETNYNLLGQRYPNNYGWYQCRWHMSAGTIYDEGGGAAFSRLWDALKTQKETLDDSALAEFLANNVHQSVANVLTKW